MIRYIKHADIDRQQWDQCVDHALNASPYASSWYLDIVANQQWDALVLDDYAAVFPLPFRVKWGIPLIYQPFFTQQLGLFVSESEQLKLLPDFLDKIPSRFRKVYLHGNAFNRLQSAPHRITYHIPLNRDYAAIHHEYGSVVVKNLKRIRNIGLVAESSADIPTFLRFMQEHLGDKLADIRPADFHMLERLLHALLDRKKGFIRYALDDEGKRIGALFIIKSHRFAIYLLAASTAKGKKLNAMTFLIDDVIKDLAGKEMVFDFEGSMIPGIAQFYQNFGATEVRFPVLKRRLFGKW